jgi:hypothetical protein
MIALADVVILGRAGKARPVHVAILGKAGKAIGVNLRGEGG